MIADRIVNIIYRIATGRRRTRSLLMPITVIIAFLYIGLFIGLALLVDKALEFTRLLKEPLSIFFSIPLLLAGLIVYFWAYREFLRTEGTPVPVNPPPTVITSGPYAYCRNPMLDGIFIVMLGLGILIGSVSLVFFFTPLFILASALELKFIEEPELVKRIGEDYVRYRSSTPRFIPRWPSR